MRSDVIGVDPLGNIRMLEPLLQLLIPVIEQFIHRAKGYLCISLPVG